MKYSRVNPRLLRVAKDKDMMHVLDSALNNTTGYIIGINFKTGAVLTGNGQRYIKKGA